MRISAALTYYDAHARVGASYPLGAARVHAIEPLPPRYPEQRAAAAALPVERIVEGEVLREPAPDVAAVLNAQRVFDVHATPASEPGAATPARSPAISAYLQNSQPYDPPALGRLIDRFI
jgi:hypothetical protein